MLEWNCGLKSRDSYCTILHFFSLVELFFGLAAIESYELGNSPCRYLMKAFHLATHTLSTHL